MTGFIADIRDRVAAAGDFVLPLDALPYAAFMGFVLEREAHELRLRMPYRRELIGAPVPPRLHGGAVGAAMEMAGIIAVTAVLEGPHNIPKPIGLTIDYLRPGGPSDTFATAEVQRLGRRVANVRASAWQDDRARPIAAAHMHFLIAG